MDQRNRGLNRNRESDRSRESTNNNNNRPFDIVRNIANIQLNEALQNITDRQQTANEVRPNSEQQQRLEGFRNRIQRLMGMDNDEQRQYLWRLMKEEQNGISTYATPHIQEWRRQQRNSIDDREMQIWDEIENGSRNEGSMKIEMDNIMKEYNLQEMQLLLDEVQHHIQQSQSEQIINQNTNIVRAIEQMNRGQVTQYMLRIDEHQLSEVLQNMDADQIRDIRNYINTLRHSGRVDQERRESLTRLSDAILEHRRRQQRLED